MIKPSLAFSAAIGLVCSPLTAEEFQGAEAILKQVAGASEKPAAGDANDPASDLAKKLRLFDSVRRTLAPAEAADQWLALLDAYRQFPPGESKRTGDGEDEESLSMKSLIAALPPTASWDRIIAGLESRAAAGKAPVSTALHLLATILGGDNAERLKAAEAIQTATSNKSSTSWNSFDYRAAGLSERMRDVIESEETDPQKVLAAFERRLAAAESPTRKDRYSSERTLEIPDLVRLAGREKAVGLLNRAVVLNREFKVTGNETRILAVEAATRNVASLKKPQWNLVTGYEGIPLYEAMVRKFGSEGSDYERGQADLIYLMALLDGGRTAEAKKFYKEILAGTSNYSWSVAEGAFELMDRNGLGGKLYAFVKELLAEDPTLPVWDNFHASAMAEGQSAEFLKILRETMDKPGIAPERLTELKQILLDHLLATGSIDEGVALLREQVASDVDQQQQPGLQLIRIGRLLQKPEWIEEGLTAAKKQIESGKRSPYYGGGTSDDLADELILLDRAPEAEDLLAKSLLTLHQSKGDNDRTYEIRQVMGQLAVFYDKTGRAADVLFLLDHSPEWGAADVKDLDSPLRLVAARSLAAIGRKAEAAAAVRQVVRDAPGSDPGYELLLKLGGDDLIALMDSIYATNRFEERPLIWKARILLDQGKVEEAEKTIRQAIAVDPSDGEQGKGDRLRAYSFLADILEKKGDAGQATNLRTAVKAIRLSEDADDWHAAGLVSKAVEMYEESLKLFADAYCIQSRLARKLTGLGEFEKAAEHYRRAFELMPDSFGRVESHCFGCEGTFSDPKAQTAAEKVFTILAEKLPDRAQVFYLFGYLKESQRKTAEAAAMFQKAVKLDPDYLNAWIHLSSAAGEAGLSPAERDEISLQILRLDPAGNHQRTSSLKFSDLRKLWDTLLTVAASLPADEDVAIYPLAASKLALAENKKSDRSSSHGWIDYGHRGDEPPAQALIKEFAEHPLVDPAIELIDAALKDE